MDLEELKKERLYPLQADEYEQDGYPYCSKCNTSRFFKYTKPDGDIILKRAKCECQQQEQDRLEELRKIEDRKREFRERQRLSMIGSKYLNATFASAEITSNNKQAFESAKAFVENTKTVIANNIGLYLYGNNSSGKTYLMACICNELVDKGYSCEFTSIPKLLAESGRNLRENRLSQAEIIDNLARKQFVFIDDLGKEFLGDRNDYNYNKAERLLLEVLNARYSNGFPTVFTSNYSLDEFIRKFNLDKAIIERLNEMATRIIRLDGENFRQKALQEKNKLAKSLGI